MNSVSLSAVLSVWNILCVDIRTVGKYDQQQWLVRDRISVFQCLPPSVCLTKKTQLCLGCSWQTHTLSSLTQSLHNHLKCKHTVQHNFAVEGSLFWEDRNLHWCVSISYITICLLCWGDLFGKAITDVGKRCRYPLYVHHPGFNFNLNHKLAPDPQEFIHTVVCSSLGF